MPAEEKDLELIRFSEVLVCRHKDLFFKKQYQSGGNKKCLEKKRH